MQSTDDQFLKEMIERELPAALEMHIEARDGQVFLSGVVDTLADKEFAVERIKRMPGVDSVENMLTVSSDKSITDADLSKVINHKLLQYEMGLSVEVHHGIAYLRGNTRDLNEQEKAIDLVSRIPGIAGIQNFMKVIKEEDTASLVNHISSALIGEDIDLSEIDVELEDDKVVLIGLVQNERDFTTIESAIKKVPGIKFVDNQLKIRDSEKEIIH